MRRTINLLATENDWELRGITLCLVLSLTGCAAALPALHSGAAAIAAQISAAPIAAAAGAAGAGVGLGIIVSDDVKKFAREASESPDETYPAGTFGAFIQEGQAAVITLVQLAMRGQREAQVVAGMQVYSALGKGLKAFPANRAVKLEALPALEAKFRSDMDVAMTNLVSASDATIKAAGDGAAEIAVKLRVAADIPLLRSAGPIFLFPFLPTQDVTIRGAFPATIDRENPPVLIVDGKTYKAIEFQPDTLRFSIRTSDLDAAEPSETIWKVAELRVAWTKPGAVFSDSSQMARFRVVLGVLTQSFGSLSLERSVSRTRTEEKIRPSETFSFASDALRADESRCLRLSANEISEGWKIRPGSGSVAQENLDTGIQGNEWRDLGIQSEGEHALCWKVRALNNPLENVDARTGAPQATWKISARIVRDVRELNVTSERVDLAWGSKHTFNVPAGAWKLRFTRNGSPARELTATDTSSPLIRVLAEESRVQVSIYPY